MVGHFALTHGEPLVEYSGASYVRGPPVGYAVSALEANYRRTAQAEAAACPRCPPVVRPRLRRPSAEAVYAVNLGVTVLVRATHALLCLMAPCPFREIGSSALLERGECVAEANLLSRLNTIHLGFLMLGMFYLYFSQLVSVARVRGWTPMKVLSCGGGGRGGAGSASWVAASSPDLYHEVVVSLKATSTVVGCILAPIFFVFLVAFLVKGASKLRTVEQDAEVMEMCGDNRLCQVGRSFSHLCAAMNVLCLGLNGILVLSAPVHVWSNTVELANRATGHVRAVRLRRTLLPVGFLLVAQTVNEFRMQGQRKTTELAISVFIQQLFQMLVNFSLLLYNRVPRDVADGVAYSLKRMRVDKPARILRRTVTFLPEDTDTSDSKVTEPQRRGPLGRTDHTMNAILLTQIILWLPRVLNETPVLVMVLVYLCRALAAAFMVVTLMRGGEGATFEDLTEGAGFGLVVRATHLRRALEDALAGRPSERRIPRFRATLFKMEHTLAVSYRWQSTERTIAPEMALNMSPFQVTGLLTAIEDSGCTYVWLDKLSVPQEECKLKYTLLARMMAIYAASASTVAIRTLEEEGGRYHQRAWTCQEFCVAARLKVITQPQLVERTTSGASGDIESAAVKCAAATEEESTVEVLREEFQAAAGEVVPLWLRGGAAGGATLSREQAVRAVTRLKRLSEELHCAVAGDMVRALLPMLTRTPVESHQQLVALLRMMGETSGLDLQRWKGELLDYHVSSRGMRRMGSSIGPGATIPGASVQQGAPDKLDLDRETRLRHASCGSLLTQKSGRRGTYTWEGQVYLDEKVVGVGSSLKPALPALRATKTEQLLHPADVYGHPVADETVAQQRFISARLPTQLSQELWTEEVGLPPV